MIRLPRFSFLLGGTDHERLAFAHELSRVVPMSVIARLDNAITDPVNVLFRGFDMTRAAPDEASPVLPSSPKSYHDFRIEFANFLEATLGPNALARIEANRIASMFGAESNLLSFIVVDAKTPGDIRAFRPPTDTLLIRIGATLLNTLTYRFIDLTADPTVPRLKQILDDLHELDRDQRDSA